MAAEILQTPYGIFGGVNTTGYYPDGKIQSICLEEQNVILTHAGELIPYYGEETLRRKHKASVTFHRNGMIKAVALEEQQEVLTPIGMMPAELITFYNTGEVCRAFPLDGKLSGFWSEEDERVLNIPLSFELDFATFTAMLSGISFFKSGQIRSITLFPGETVDVITARYGTIPARNGFALDVNGLLESLEPAIPTPIQTPIGALSAYDVTAAGICADTNSLRFDKQGRVVSLTTSGSQVLIRREGNGENHHFVPMEIDSDDSDTVSQILPLNIQFDYDCQITTITGPGNIGKTFMFTDHYLIFSKTGPRGEISCNDCSACNRCK